MLLVVMAVVLAVAGARQDCSSGCHLTNIALQVESCGRIESVYTTLCVGHCFNKDPVYVGAASLPEQKVCNGNWTYEVKQIPGCPVSITYPVATHCECTSCNEQDSHCGSWFGDTPSCLSF